MSEKQKSVLGVNSPRKQFRLKRSFAESEGQSGGKTIRSRFFSHNDSGFLSPSRSRKKAMAKGVDGQYIPTVCYSNILLDNKNMVKMMRLNIADSFNVMAEGAYTKFVKKVANQKSYKFTKMNVVLSEGKLTIKPNESAGPTKYGKNQIAIHNICNLTLSNEKKMISFHAWVKGKVIDDAREPDVILTYKLKFGSQNQAKHIAEKLLIECENYGIVLDLNLGFFNVNGIQPDIEPHVETLIRKRYAMFAISKPDGSAAKNFALEQLITFLQQHESTTYEAKMWKAKFKEGSFNLSGGQGNNDLRALQEERAIAFKDCQGQLEETIGSMFFSQKIASDSVHDSYYITHHNKGQLAQCD